MYKEVCKAHLMLGGSGGMVPRENSDPLSSLLVHFLHYTYDSHLLHSVNHAAMHRKKQWQPSFKGGVRFWQGGANAAQLDVFQI